MSRIVFVDTEVSTESGRVCFHITAAKTTQMPVLKREKSFKNRHFAYLKC